MCLTAFDRYCVTSWVKLLICHHGTCRTWHLRKSSSSTAPQEHLCLLFLTLAAHPGQVSMAEFMSDEDLEALKADTNVEMPASAQSTNGQVQHSIKFACIGPMHKQHYVIPNNGGNTALRCPLQVNRHRATSLHAKDQAAVLCKLPATATRLS